VLIQYRTVCTRFSARGPRESLPPLFVLVLSSVPLISRYFSTGRGVLTRPLQKHLSVFWVVPACLLAFARHVLIPVLVSYRYYLAVLQPRDPPALRYDGMAPRALT
jgi:hypothetical protein